MATRATPTILEFAQEWESLFASAQLSGVVGDTDHQARGGYHISIADQSDPQNYSVVRPDDKAPPGTWPRDCASAVDMNLALADMKLAHGRLRDAWRNRANDPRIGYLNAWNGWDGEDSAGRYDVVTGTVATATDDHKWHIHLEFRRRYVNDNEAMAAVLSILRGESLSDYLEDDMPTGEDVWKTDIIPNPKQRGDASANPATTAYFAVGDLWQLAYNQRDALAVLKAQLAALGASLTAAIAALAAKDQVDEKALATELASGVASQVIAALPADRDDITVDELQAAVVGALRLLLERPAA